MKYWLWLQETTGFVTTDSLYPATTVLCVSANGKQLFTFDFFCTGVQRRLHKIWVQQGQGCGLNSQTGNSITIWHFCSALLSICYQIIKTQRTSGFSCSEYAKWDKKQNLWHKHTFPVWVGTLFDLFWLMSLSWSSHIKHLLVNHCTSLYDCKHTRRNRSILIPCFPIHLCISPYLTPCNYSHTQCLLWKHLPCISHMTPDTVDPQQLRLAAANT